MQDESGWVRHRFEPLILAATLALIPVLVVETDARSHTWKTVTEAANWLIWAVFLAELLLVLTVAERRAAALRAHWLETTLVLLTVPALGAALSGLRLLRLLRLMRFLRFGALLARALRLERATTSTRTFRFVGLVTVMVVVVGGAAQATFDQHDFKSVWDGVWWAVVTVTTVGYGDLYPKTVAGRAIGICLMLAGIGFLSVLTATIASRFVQADEDPEQDQILATLSRIERELRELRARLDG